MTTNKITIYTSAGVITHCCDCPGGFESILAQGSSWITGESDHNTQYVLNGAICTYTSAEITAKNNLPQGYVWQMPERVAVDTRTLAVAQSQAWERIKTLRSLKESLPFTCNGSVYDANMTNISGAVQLATLAQMTSSTYTVDWTLYDNTIKTLDAAGIIAVGTTLGSLISSIYNTARTLRSAIQACTTNAQADAITWPTA